ncbi:hypothetical protein IW261DRAFT_1502040 [Armillaria novae-zelandiae]|uniref:Uncharacterized protein n=1 Tax=Armillaria novae-zelandiae TaxID=153914 RepID=A0AA39NYG6_9AGAR|nr:hypothetical protein IW261DRAFT_1502040 [Armillaria novae-zelandiae]
MDRPGDSRNWNACITISHALHHFLSIIQSSHSQEDDCSDINASRIRLSLIFGSRQEFEDWWTREIEKIDQKRRALSTFDEMNDHLEYLESICRTTAIQSSKEYEMKFICAQSAVKLITQGILPVAPDSVVETSLNLLDYYLDKKQEHEFQRIVAPQWEDPNPMTLEIKKRIAKLEDPILVHRASRVADPPIIGHERSRSPYQFVNVYVKETKPRNTFADILEAMRSKAPGVDNPKYKSKANSEQKEQPPRGNTNQSRATSENLRSASAAEPAELDGFDNLDSETPFNYDDDSGDSELLTIIREAFSDNPESNPAAPKRPERRRRSSSCGPNTPSPAKRNIEDDEPNPDQSSFPIPKEEDLAMMFDENPWFAFKKRNPKQVFLWDYNANCVPFKVVKGGKVSGEWAFILDLAYRKDALYQFLATSVHGNDPSNKMIDILRKFDGHPAVVYKKTFVTRDKAFRFTVKELWCDEEWKFNLEAKVTFSRLRNMMKTSRRVEMESELWPDWLDYFEKK